MIPKGKPLALLFIFVAIGGIVATGAFTTVQAERTATVEIGGDNAALLGITEPQDSPYSDGDLVTYSGGVAQINLGEDALSADGVVASGLNPDANSTVAPLATVTNNGNEEVILTMNASSVNTNINDFNASDVRIVNQDGANISQEELTLSPGQSQQFGLNVDLTGVDQNDYNSFEITIDITADDADGT